MDPFCPLHHALASSSCLARPRTNGGLAVVLVEGKIFGEGVSAHRPTSGKWHIYMAIEELLSQIDT